MVDCPLGLVFPTKTLLRVGLAVVSSLLIFTAEKCHIIYTCPSCLFANGYLDCF
jgi:hypothetical protein